jgi:chromate transporter
MPSLRQIFWTAARDVNSTVGGGMAGIELLRRSCTSRGWLTPEDYGLVMAVSRLTPGTNILAFCMALGWKFRRLRGSLAAVTGASVPSSIIIVTLSALIVRIVGDPRVQVVLAVLMLVACWLIVMVAWNLLRPFLFSVARWRAAAVSAVAIALYAAGITPVRILLASAIVGLAIPMPPVRRGVSAASDKASAERSDASSHPPSSPPASAR